MVNEWIACATHPCDGVTVFGSNVNLMQVEANEVSAHRQMLSAIAVYWPFSGM